MRKLDSLVGVLGVATCLVACNRYAQMKQNGVQSDGGQLDAHVGDHAATGGKGGGVGGGRAGGGSAGKAGASSSGTGGSATQGFDAGTPDAGAAVNDTAPIGSDLAVVFPTAYSGYDGVHTFKIPAVVPNVVGVKWSASDTSYVDLDARDTTAGEGSVMITTKRAGSVRIIARAGQLSGSALLNITAYDAGDCNAGQARYNEGPGIDGGVGLQALVQNADKRTACHACHGMGAQFLSVQHTPLQTGGFTDQDMQDIFTKGYKPDGSIFVTPFPPQIYQMFHKWLVTDQEKIGLVCYMRSITPQSVGMLDFQGVRPAGTPSRVPCGTTQCTNIPDTQRPAIPGAGLVPACCADAVTSICGTVSGNGSCAPPPAPAAHCPMALGTLGCCAGGNSCGVDASPEGMGCVETAQLKASINTLLLPGLMLPDSAHCDGTPWESQDAGR